MSEFSSTDAALEGLRVSREHPLAVLWWWGANVAASLAAFALWTLPPYRRVAAMIPQFQSVGAAMQLNPTDQALANQYLALVMQALPPMLLFAAITMVLRTVLVTAVLRAALRPGDRAFGYLRVSMDELRQILLSFLIVVVFLGYAAVVSLVSWFVTAIIAGLIGGSGATFLAGAMAFVLVGLAFLYPAVRLSLAPAMTFADGKISLFRSWPLTKGRFWPLFGAYLVAGVFAVMIVGFLRVGETIVNLRRPPELTQNMAELLSPLLIGFFLFNGLFGALFVAVTTAPGASAFRQLTGRVGAPSAPKSNSGSPWGQA